MQGNAERVAPTSRWFVTVARTQTTLVEVEADGPDTAIEAAYLLDFDALHFDPAVEPEYTVGPVESA